MFKNAIISNWKEKEIILDTFYAIIIYRKL